MICRVLLSRVIAFIVFASSVVVYALVYDDGTPQLGISNSILLRDMFISPAGNTFDPLPSDFLTTPDLVRREGYQFQNHTVVTEDGYILQLHRVNRPSTSPPGTPVYFNHGFIACSDMYVLRGRKQDLPYLLADLGFDVWLGNLRGNYFSKNHMRLSTSDPKFWDFDFEEMGEYDIPAFIDYIIAMTGHPKVFFIGHSMGTTSFFTMMGIRPEMNDKIILSVLMAPVAASIPTPQVPSPAIRLLLMQQNLVRETLVRARIVELAPRTSQLVSQIKVFCSRPETQNFCLDLYGLVYGEHRANFDLSKFGEEASHYPAGASFRTLNHFSQLYPMGLRRYDYGREGNLRKYNSTRPPPIPLSKVACPTAIIYSENDALVTPKAALSIANQMRNLVSVMKVQDPHFTHIDYTLGNNNYEQVFIHVIRLLESYNPKSNEFRRRI